MIGHNVSMLMTEKDRDRHDSYLERFIRTGEQRVIGIGREVLGKQHLNAVFRR